MQNSQTLPIIFNLIAAIFGAVGQWLYKMGAGQMKTIPLYKNWPLFVGVISFCVVMGLFVAGFRAGGKLSVTYPVYATTFLWGMLIAVQIEKETWSWIQLVGVSFIVVGVSLIAAFYPKEI